VSSFKDGLLRRATSSAERRLLRRYPVISTLTPRLTDRVKMLAPRAQVETVPLGLDLSPYRFQDRALHDPPTVALIGSFDWYPTLSGARRLLDRLWPAIKQRVPDARLLLVGRCARSRLERYVDLPDVDIYEDVPDILPYFEATDVMLYAPARGSGMKVKVLEAFALGVPVVTTSEGVEGIAAEDGVHAGVADDDKGLVQRTVDLLQDRSAWQAMRKAARPLVESACDPEQSLDLVERCYESIGSER
jgi:glycosyltransferase involved in cell wall biosynthesis